MQERLKKIIKHSGIKLPVIEKESGIALARWKGVLYAGSRVNQDHINFVAKKWPHFVYWLVTGETQEECGNISPDIEEYNRLKSML